jgi:cytohesin
LLSKRRLGEFLGGSKEFNKQVCDKFLKQLNFASLTMEGALRATLTTFRLPGEAQQIDRILEKFANCYYSANSDSFSSSDTVYILSFSLIMLNTDLHSRKIDKNKKMTLEEFIKNNRGIDNSNDLPRKMLEDLYNSIKNEEIRMNETDQNESENVAFMAPTRSSFLEKIPEKMVQNILDFSYKKRWFVLTDGCLYYFTNQNDDAPRGIIPLDNVHIGRLKNRDFIIRSTNGDVVKSSKLKRGSMKQGARKKFILRAESEEEREQWVDILQRESARFKPLHDIFLRLQRKKSGRPSGANDDTITLPKPYMKGWMRKKGSSSSTWTRRYFMLCPDFDGEGCTLFYYISKEAAQLMQDLGEQTQSGFLRMRRVTKVEFSESDACGTFTATSVPTIYVNVDNEAVEWTFIPEEHEGSMYSDTESDIESTADSTADYDVASHDEFENCADRWYKALSRHCGALA